MPKKSILKNNRSQDTLSEAKDVRILLDQAPKEVESKRPQVFEMQNFYMKRKGEA